VRHVFEVIEDNLDRSVRLPDTPSCLLENLARIFFLLIFDLLQFILCLFVERLLFFPLLFLELLPLSFPLNALLFCKESLIHEMKLSLVDRVWLRQNWAIVVRWIFIKSFFEFLVIIGYVLCKFGLGHLQAVVQLDRHLLLLLENEFIVRHVLLCVGLEVCFKLMQV